MSRLLAAVLLMTTLSLATGCSDDCQRLADLACARLGDTTEECRQVRAHADRASADDKRVCALALKVADDFEGRQ